MNTILLVCIPVALAAGLLWGFAMGAASRRPPSADNLAQRWATASKGSSQAVALAYETGMEMGRCKERYRMYKDSLAEQQAREAAAAYAELGAVPTNGDAAGLGLPTRDRIFYEGAKR